MPHQPLHHRIHFLCSPKPKKYELGLHLKSIIGRTRVANSVMGKEDPETRRNEARMADSEGGFSGGWQRASSHQLEVLGERCKQTPPAGSGAEPRKIGFWSILGPQKSRQNGQLAFESGATSESGGHVPPAPT